MLAFLTILEEHSASPATILILGALLLVLGLVLIIVSIRHFRQSGVVSHTPEIQVRELRPGLARVYGRVEGDSPLVSPLTASSCFYYESYAQKHHGNPENEQVSTLRRVTNRRDFYVNDGTGRVLVEPDHAEFDLTPALETSLRPGQGVSSKIDPALGLPDLTEHEFRALIHWDWKSPKPDVAASEEKTEEKEHKRKWWIPEALDLGGFEIGLSDEAREFTLTETCLHAGRSHSIIATCEVIADSGGRQSLMLKRGSAESTFVISSERGEKMAGRLRKRALLILLAGLFLLGFGAIMILTRRHWVTG